MSGICGVFDPKNEPSASSVSEMVDALALPDESERSQLSNSFCAIGVSRRWSFQQTAAVEGILVAADADLVNRQEIADALSLSTNSVASMNVAELIARLYVARGRDFFQCLHGGFALALWDDRTRTLILAIDRIGIKTLYLRREGPRLLFASRIRAIRAVQNAAPEVNPSAVLQFLIFSAVPAPLASDRGVEKMRPGTWVEVQEDRVTEHQYWDLEFPESDDQNVSQWSRDLQDAMRAAVHRHLGGCHPEETGCYLSGGTDSSSVVALASEIFKPTQTFSIAFNESAFSEIEFARTAATKFQTKHFEKFLTAADACDAIEKIIDYYDEPFANSSAVGSYHCALLAREKGVNTVLAGDGGDELFGGNQRYARDRYFSMYGEVPAWLRRGVIEPIVGLLPLNGSVLSLPRKYVQRAKIPNPRRMLSYGFFLSSPACEIFDDGFLCETAAQNWLAVPEAHFTRAKAKSELNRILYTDVKMTLADNDLRKVSGTAELAGVNVRYPLLDDRLAEFSGRIPATLKLKGFEKRFLFKQAMKEILPEKIINKKKHGFGVPLAQWLLQNPRMTELMQDTMQDSVTRQRGYFRMEFLAKLRELHRIQPNYYGEIVWYLVALELWHRKHLKRAGKTVHAF